MANILVVDDELGIRDLLFEILNDEGHAVELAENAAQARAAESRALGAVGTANPIAIPGVRPLDRAISSAIDRLNRPLDLVTNVSRAVSTSTDPSFPTTQGVIVITVVRP